METEPEWSDDDRFQMLGLARHNARVCACGFHEDVASDPDNYFSPTERVCPVCRGIARQSRTASAADADEAKRLEDKPEAPRVSDGRHLGMRLLTPDEVAAAKKSGG